jgi:heme O synthase-like polyprenyltransferase
MPAYSIAQSVAMLLPVSIGVSGAMYAVFAVRLGAGFVFRVWQLRQSYSDALVRRTLSLFRSRTWPFCSRRCSSIARCAAGSARARRLR